MGFNQHLFLEASCVCGEPSRSLRWREVGLSSPSRTFFREDTLELFRRATTWVCLQSFKIGTISLNSGLSCEKNLDQLSSNNRENNYFISILPGRVTKRIYDCSSINLILLAVRVSPTIVSPSPLKHTSRGRIIIHARILYLRNRPSLSSM